MTEIYQATRDALTEVVNRALGDKAAPQLPWYARTSEKRGAGLTDEKGELGRALAIWKLNFPDRVN